MRRIVIDPLSRIEGHLRIEAEVENGAVQRAWSAATMFRGIELILKGRDPRDAWVFTQRICGVCTTVHAIASLRAVENALGVEPPPNARLLRNIIMATQTVQDHVIHFYHLHALDWVDVVSALEADPQKTSSLAQSCSDWPLSSSDYFSGMQSRLKAFVDRGQLGPFAHAYWGHPAFRLPPEANLMAVAHYLEALQWQRKIARIHALLGGKNPHLQGFLVGGMATPADLAQHASQHMGSFAEVCALVEEARKFVNEVYLPDLLAVAAHYREWADQGAGVGNFLACGDYPETEGGNPELFLPAGVIRQRDLAGVGAFDQALVTEEVARSWYASAEPGGQHPFEGDTRPDYTGPRPPYEQLNVDDKYSWCKAPCYDGQPMEVGPLARMLVAYAQGHGTVRRLVDSVLSHLGLSPLQLVSTLGRTAARAIETKVLADRTLDWVELWTENIRRGDLRMHQGQRWEPERWPSEAIGFGLHEAARGALGHWVRIEDGAIANYQCVVPTTWNASPRDAQGNPGPLEAALEGTPVEREDQPLELLRTAHSFDPCIACAVHVVDLSGRPVRLARAS